MPLSRETSLFQNKKQRKAPHLFLHLEIDLMFPDPQILLSFMYEYMFEISSFQKYISLDLWIPDHLVFNEIS